MTDQQTLAHFAAAVDSLPATKPRECDPSYTLERHIASLRDTDPVRWAELQKEWAS